MEQRKLIKQAKATPAELDGAISKRTGSSRKSSKKLKEAAATASQPDPDPQAEYVSDLKKAKEATEKATAKVELAAVQLYTNLLSVYTKYEWNKIIQKQT
jgi:hypothetical protein